MKLVLSLLTKLIASLLVSTLFIAVLTLALDKTIFSSDYLNSQLVSTNSYDKLSNAIADRVAKTADSPDPTLKSNIETIVTPRVLQQKVSTALNQLEKYY